MSATLAAAEERLQRVLDAPVQRRPSVLRELAEERAHHGRPAGVVVKQVAIAEPPAETSGVTGEFVALVSDFGVDRDGERFTPGAWDKALAKIKQAGRPIPLLFGHDARNANAVIGVVQPDDIWVDERGLWVKGWLEVADPLGQRLYKLVEKGVLQWSVGFSISRKQRGPGGVTLLTEVGELFEVSAVPIPANPRTVTAGMKTADPDRQPPSLAALRALERSLGLDAEAQQLRADELRAFERRLGLDPEAQELRDDTRHRLISAMHHNGNSSNGANGKRIDALKREANRIEQEHALTLALAR